MRLTLKGTLHCDGRDCAKSVAVAVDVLSTLVFGTHGEREINEVNSPEPPAGWRQHYGAYYCPDCTKKRPV